MGTNYYAEYDKCGECNRFERIHIGKSSAGWVFALHVTDTIKNLDDWKRLLCTPGVVIRDEYDKEVPFNDLMDNITKRSHPRGLWKGNPKWYATPRDMNAPELPAEPGESFEYITGEFS